MDQRDGPIQFAGQRVARDEHAQRAGHQARCGIG
jgi:hypothetical protein